MHADLRFALRTLRKTPGLTAVALLCLAVAIGLATAAFSVVHGAFLAPLPVAGGDRLVMVHDYHRSGRYNVPMTAAQFTSRRERSVSFDALGAWYSRNVTVGTEVGGSSSTPLIRAAYVSPTSLGILGVAPLLGRHASEADVAAGAMPSVILSHEVWRSRFGGDAGILGRTVPIVGTPHVVIGVMPPRFAFPVRDDLWIPVQTDARAPNATGASLTMFGRLRDGVSRREAAAELAVLEASDTQRDAATATVPLVMPFTRGYMRPEDEWALYGFLLGVAAFLVVIAANLSNLFLARNAARTREIALRAALGAGRGRLVRQLVLESLVLACGGALAGLAVARASLAWFESHVEDLPWWADFGLNPTMLGFLALSGLVATVVAGVGPARRLTRVSICEPLKGGATTTSGLRFSRVGAALIVVQIAVSVGLLSVVGVLAQALFGFGYQKYQIQGTEVLVAQVYLGPPDQSELSRPGADRRVVWRQHYERSLKQIERIADRIRERAGVRSVTYSSHFPGNDVEAVRIELERGATGASAFSTRVAEVGPDFFETLGARIEQGRDFAPADFTGPARAVIVNAPFARKYFPGRNPLGRTLRVLTESDARRGPWLEIVGVAPDLALNPGDPGRADGIYLPFSPSNFARLAVRTDVQPTELVALVHEIVVQENANAQVQSAESLESQMDAAAATFRVLGTGLLVIGATALLLSAVSLYSLVSFSVSRRTHEIGIRLALGATPGRILKAVIEREVTVILAGAAAGVLLGVGLYRLVALIPFDLRPAGPALLVGFVALMLVIGAGACLVPARRALWIAPAEALRQDH